MKIGTLRGPYSTGSMGTRGPKITGRMETCHWNFGPGKNGPRTKISTGKIGPPDHFFRQNWSYPENFGPPVKF